LLLVYTPYTKLYLNKLVICENHIRKKEEINEKNNEYIVVKVVSNRFCQVEDLKNTKTEENIRMKVNKNHFKTNRRSKGYVEKISIEGKQE